MNNVVKELSDEIVTLERMINGYLLTNSALKDIVVDTMTFKLKEADDSGNDLVAKNKDAKINVGIKRVYCCKRNGQMYFRNSPCPQGEKKCEE